MVNKAGTSDESKQSSKFVITVTANFTAEPLGDTLRFWMDKLELRQAELKFSGYNQVFQELMAPDSLMAANEAGVNFLLIRLEDWAREQPSSRTSRSNFDHFYGIHRHSKSICETGTSSDDIAVVPAFKRSPLRHVAA